MALGAWTLVLLIGTATGLSSALGANATGPISLDPSGLTQDQIPAAQRFVEDVNRALPEKLASSFGQPIQVRFGALGSPSQANLEISCNGSSKVELGFVSRDQANVITLNQGLLPDILSGPESSRKLDCMHGSYYKEAKATTIHELGHLFDFKTETSGRSDFLLLNGWDSDKNQKNTVYSRSMDPYEFSDPAEAFAVNLEYFVLDPEYPCRRPSNANFFTTLIGTAPGSSPVDCSKNRALFVGNDLTPTSIDPKRVYQIQYLQAEPGSEMMSRWGHAMIRLVICDPKREKPGPECLQDVDHHVVLSYRAGVNDLKVSSLKGLTGAYPSRLYAFTLNQILEEYGRGELRDLKGYPLKLTEAQKANLLDYLLEQYWTYEGKYYFLSNNCATETRKAIQAGLREKPGSESLETPPIISPIDLQKALEQAGLVDSSVFENPKQATENGYSFPSQHKVQLENAFHSVRDLIPAQFPTLEKYLYDSTARERSEIIATAAPKLRANPRLAASFLLLEFQTDRINNKRILQALASLGEKGDRPEVAQLLQMQQALAPWNVVAARSYGIPSIEELNPCNEQVASDLQSLGTKLSELVSAALPDLKSDAELTDKNLVSLMEYLKLLNRN